MNKWHSEQNHGIFKFEFNFNYAVLDSDFEIEWIVSVLKNNCIKGSKTSFCRDFKSQMHLFDGSLSSDS